MLNRVFDDDRIIPSLWDRYATDLNWMIGCPYWLDEMVSVTVCPPTGVGLFGAGWTWTSNRMGRASNFATEKAAKRHAVKAWLQWLIEWSDAGLGAI